jgi:Fe-S-cluster-containing dehydrogenase component
MLYDATLCIGCKACVVACRETNGLPPSRDAKDGNLHDMQMELNANTKNVIKSYSGPAREGQAAQQSYMKSQCMHCIDPACVSVCMIGALKKREFGVVTYDKDLCVGCRYCQMACPFDVPKFEWASTTPKIVKCEMCVHRLVKHQQPACTEACPRQAVIFGKLEGPLRPQALRGNGRRGNAGALPGRRAVREAGASGSR